MSDPEQTRRRLQAQTAAARVLLSSDTVDEGIDALLQVVCEALGWSVGEYWSPSPSVEGLRLEAQWLEPGGHLSSFLKATRSLTVHSGSGLAGRVWQKSEPIRVADVTRDPQFIRSKPARKVGLRGAFAVPVPLTGTNGVLLFLDDEPADADPELLDGLAALGAQLGQFIDRRRAEAGLEESEDRFRTFARTVPDPAFLLDRNSRILFLNDAVRDIFGYEPRELYGRSFLQLLPERHHDRHREGLKRHDRRRPEGFSWTGVELEGLRQDGSEIPIEITYGTFEKDGQRFFTAVARDVTDRKLSEDRLRFQARLLDAVGEAVIATQLDGTVLYWNDAAERLYGWSAGEVLGRTVDEIARSDVSPAQARAIMERLKEGESWSGEFLVEDRSGREFPVMVTDSPFLGEHGEIVGIISTSSDISDRKRDEAAQRFLAEAGRVLAASLDLETTAETVARLAVPTLADWCLVQVTEDGYTPPRTVATALEEDPDLLAKLEHWVSGPGRPGILDVLRRSEAIAGPGTDGPVPMNDESLTTAGIGSVLCVPLKARGNALGVLTLARAGTAAYDHRDRRLAAELGRRAALAMDNARLYRGSQEANRAKADFLAVVSHELRTPLNAIGGYADLLESGVTGDLTEGQARYVERIKVGASHLAQLIDEILAFARVEAHREQLLFRLADLTRVARDAMAVVEPQAVDRGLELELDISATPVELVTDADKVRQVLVNLLSNAVKYTEQGRVSLTVRALDDGSGEVTVADTGIGIGEEHIDLIFEPFWQAESPNTRKTGGTGLGLSVGKRLVTLLGGSISVASEPGVGSTFTVWLPAHPPDEPPDADLATG